MRPDDWTAVLVDLPAQVSAVLDVELPALAPGLIAAVQRGLPDYDRPLRGAFGRGVRSGVGAAVREFAAVVADPGRDRSAVGEVYRQLGREECRDGRDIDGLRSALAVGGRTMWRRIAALDLPAPAVFAVGEALFAFLDELGSRAVAGYLEEAEATATETGVLRRRLLALLLAGDAAEGAVRRAAEAARWPLPDRLAVLLTGGSDADQVARLVSGSLGVPVEEGVCVLVADPDGPGRLARLRSGWGDRSGFLGPAVPWVRARRSHRQARRASGLAAEGVLPARGLVVVAEHRVEVLLRWEPEVGADLVASALAPLSGVAEPHRGVLAATLAAWLRHQGRVPETAVAVSAHPQTIRYRLRQLRVLFGAALDEPDARFALEMALRLSSPC